MKYPSICKDATINFLDTVSTNSNLCKCIPHNEHLWLKFAYSTSHCKWYGYKWL